LVTTTPVVTICIVVVLGQPGFDSRFGFARVSSYGIGCEYEIPADVFMVVALEPGALAEAKGIVKYHRAFTDV
jgi:putative acetyltransferase